MILKILLAILLLLLSPSIADAANWCLHDDVEACFLIETGSGEVLEDETGNYDGAFLNAGEPAWDANTPAAYSDWSVDFDASDDQVISGDLDLTGTFTFVFWLYLESSITNSRIFSKDGSPTYYNANYYAIQKPAGNIDDMTVGFRGGSAWEEAKSTGNEIVQTTWLHIAGVNTGTQMQLWINGVDSYSDDSIVNNPTTSDIDLAIGGSYGANYFGGDLDELAFFSAGFDSDDLNDIMDNGLFEAGATRRRWMIN